MFSIQLFKDVHFMDSVTVGANRNMSITGRCKYTIQPLF